MIRAWRIVKAKHAIHAFDGEGSRLYGSRWNSPGVRVVHVSATLSLATLEIIAHLQGSTLLSHYVAFFVEFDGSFVERINIAELPADWRNSPPPSTVRQIGDLWVRGSSSPILEVPSALIPSEVNYLLNPSHADFSRIVLSSQLPLDVDPRVFR